jgi:hypothetical protein
MYGKRHKKKRHPAHFVFVPSVFRKKFPTAEFFEDIGRNFLLGRRKKIAKCLMGTFTCRSNFLYGSHLRRFCHYLHREASMQDITVARIQSKCNVLRESLSVDSQIIPCATLKRRWSWVIFAYLCPNLAQDL